MGYTVREADIIQEKKLILDTLNNNRSMEISTKRYDWVYLNNPFGKARAWLVFCDQTGEIAGGIAAFPRLMSVCGKEILCWTCGDFSINPKFRTLGPAVKLRKAVTLHVDQGNISFLYSHPNKKAKGVHLMAGNSILGEMVRYAQRINPKNLFPVTVNESWLHKKLRIKTISRLYLQCLDVVFYHRCLHGGSTRKKGSFTSKVCRDFPEEVNFAELFDRIKKHYPVIGVRSREYLEWRFWANPTPNPI